MRVFIKLTKGVGERYTPTNERARATRSFIGVRKLIELYGGAAPEEVVKDWLKFVGDSQYLGYAVRTQHTLERIEA